MPRNDKNITPSVTQKLQDLGYNVADWDNSKTKITDEIREVLSTASKAQSGNCGFPDRVYCNENKKLLILVEEKPNITDHDIQDIEKGAISGVKWYLERFMNKNLNSKLKNFFDSWKILGIAVSGDLGEEFKHKFNCYFLDTKIEKIENLNQISNFVKEESFLSIFNNLNEEKAILSVSTSSKTINNLLRSIDSQKRPILLSTLMICLHRSKKCENNFPDHYKTYSNDELIVNIPATALKILEKENIPQEKLKTLKSELAFLETDQSLNSNTILKQILIELETNVIPLFNSSFSTDSNYDILGKFYEEFLKYAGISNVKKGIVLTPRHITSLFTKLIPLKDDDRIVDICCGTGAFLIASMNELIKKIEKSNRSDKIEAINNVKTNQLLGFDNNSTMYICAISNMLFRGDGKSSIYNYDSINNPQAQKILNEFKPTIGFINPPYSGKENKEDPTPKEITFLIKLLSNCSRYAVMIAPLSVYFKEDEIREKILEKHTLKYVINMPKDLFQPNAMTHTAICVFETNRAFDYENDEAIFYDLREDGFVLSKNKGRTDVYNRWDSIEKELIEAVVKGNKQPDNITFSKTKIKIKDEWTIYAHSNTDYLTLNENNFINTIGDYVIFKKKQTIGILNEKLTEFNLLTLLLSEFETKNKKTYKKLDTTKWSDKFTINDLFIVQGSTTTPLYDLETIYGYGEYPYITTKATDNGVSGFYDHKTEKGNVLVVDSAVLGYISYQEQDFSASDHTEILTPRENTILNKWTAMFLKTIIMKGGYKYAYGRKYNQPRIRKTRLLLPIDKNNQPDWQYMEDYVKSLPYGDLI